MSLHCLVKLSSGSLQMNLITNEHFFVPRFCFIPFLINIGILAWSIALYMLIVDLSTSKFMNNEHTSN